MRKVLLPLVLLFAGCATKIETPGHKFVTYADMAEVSLSMPGVSYTGRGVRHSTHTAVASRGITQGLGAIGTALLPLSNVPGIIKAAPILPASGIGPMFRTGESRP